MKKLLLSLATVALAASTSWANETTLTFDGEGDVAGLTRITGTSLPTADQCVKEFEFTQDDINCTFTTDLVMHDSSIGKDVQSTGAGFALFTNTNPSKITDSGIYISTNVNTQISLSVPGGKISEVKLNMSGYAVGTLSIITNGTAIDLSPVANGLYSCTWNDTQGAETVTMQILRTFMARYIHSIEITYSPDLGGKEECGLAFNTKSAEAIMGQSNTFPLLSNPHKLPLKWSSSNESVATVAANGTVTLIGRGKTTITAATEGNDTYAAGNAKYDLTVIPVATNLLQMKEFAPAIYDRVKADFPMTVTFANLGYAFVTDAEGNAGYIYNKKNEGSTSLSATTIYKVGDIIPAGWVASNATIYESLMWEGIPAEVTETTDVIYPAVTSVTTDDVDRVVILKNVTFATSTPYGNTKAFGTTPNGDRYEFQDTYNVPMLPAGTYDVTGAVRYAKVGSSVYFYISPIAYADPAPEVDPTFPESFDVTLSSQNLKVEQGVMYGLYTILVTGECPEDTVTVKLAVPDGWDGYLAVKDEDIIGGDDPAPLATRAEEEEIEWTPIEPMIEFGFKKSNKLEFAVDGEAHAGQFYLYKGTEAANRPISVEVEVKKTGAGVNSIETDGSEARYFNLQGIEVENPSNGIFVKVSNGKASKLIKK